MKIDAHSHFLPREVIEEIRKNGERYNSEVVVENGREFIVDRAGTKCPVFEEYYDYDRKVSDLDKMGIDMAVLSVVPNFYYYWIDAGAALNIAQICNDWVADFCRKHPDRFRGMADIPMQDPELALSELRRAHETLGLNALATAPMICETHLDDERFFPIYEYCEAHDILVYLHPCFEKAREELKDYYNTNFVGNVYQTNLGLNNLILGGVFEKYPKLKVFASHGGGYFPYQLGRLRHGYEVRTEPHKNISRSPETYVGNIYFDTITHWGAALQFLVDTFGSDHVMIGTDYPFDMGDYHPVEHLGEIRLTESQRQNIFWDNAAKIFGL
jgi:aminocarboxymuconate-semialdehyde decarboxylase